MISEQALKERAKSLKQFEKQASGPAPGAGQFGQQHGVSLLLKELDKFGEYYLEVSERSERGVLVVKRGSGDLMLLDGLCVGVQLIERGLWKRQRRRADSKKERRCIKTSKRLLIAKLSTTEECECSLLPFSFSVFSVIDRSSPLLRS